MAERMRAVAERSELASPLAGRLAGDEFTLLLPGATVEQAEAVATAVLRALEQPFTIGGAHLSIGASIGVATRPEHGDTLQELMRAAGVAMYHAKASGRVGLFSDALAERIADRDRLDAELRAGVDAGQFGLVFQPQLRVCDRARRGGDAAALAAPDRGTQAPGRVH